MAVLATPLAAAAQTSPLIIDQNRADRRTPPPAASPARAPAGRVERKAGAIDPFVLREVRFEGAPLGKARISLAARSFVGRTLNTAGLNALADAVAAAMAKTDVALYTVVLPNQTFVGGVVHLQIVEGYVEEVTVTGARAARRDIRRVRALASPLTQGRPLLRSHLERSLSLIRDIPGLKADVQILRGNGPGAVRLAIALKQKVFSAALGVNNRGTAELGRTQVEVDLRANGLLRSGDVTQLTVAFPTDIQRFQYYALSQSEPIGASGLTATASLGYLVTRPASIAIHGSAVTGGLQLSYPIVRRYTETLFVSGSLDGVNSDNALFGQTLTDERTRALRVAAAYTKNWPKTSLTASATGSFGLNALGARVLDSRMSDTDFKKLNVRGGLDQQLSPQWIMRIRAAAQYSGDPLPATEQFALGGQEFGRAFESAIIVGDYGVAGSTELAWRPAIGAARLKGSEVYGFVDGGKLWRRDRTVLPGETHDLASTGFGARVPVVKETMLEIEADHGLDAPTGAPRGDWRIVFGLKTAI